MYNSENKSRYIEEKESSVILTDGFLGRVFRKTSEFEEERGKDVCDWSRPEILEYYKCIGTASMDSLYTLNSTLSLYTEWCIANNLSETNQNNFTNMTNDELFPCVDLKKKHEGIITREELLDMIGYLKNESDRFIILALFEGIQGDYFTEILDAKTTDIHNGVIKLVSGRELPISKELEKIAYAAANANKYFCIGGMQEKVVDFHSAAMSDEIIKDFQNTYSTDTLARRRRIYTRLIKLLTHLGIEKRVNAASLMESGRVWYIKEELKKYNLPFETYMKFHEIRKPMEYRYGKIRSIEAYIKLHKDLFN